MRRRSPWIITCSLLFYRWLLTLTPDEFAGEYAEPAVQVFQQCCREAYRKHGAPGVLRLWLPTFGDALAGILAEQSATLKQELRPRWTWLLPPALLFLLFPFSWLNNAWQPFSALFRLIFATPQAYILGHIVLFCTVGLLLLLSMPALRQHVHLYVLALMTGAFAEESIQLLVNAHPGLRKDGSNFFLDLGGILLAYALLSIWHHRRFWQKNDHDITPEQTC